MTGTSHAALFEDGDARKQINVLTESLKTNQKAVLELSISNDKLNQENQELRGQIEELKKGHEELTESLKSYYTELNARLQKFEPQDVEIEGVKGTSQPGEKDAYDLALKDFQNGDLSKANKSLSDFISKYPSSPYWPLAKYWLANTQYAQKDYKAGISTAQSLIKRYPEHKRVPEALNTIANCQIESGQKSDARKTLESITKNYPNTKAAENAASALAKLK
ncbi:MULTISPECIES: tol-pal system protein YbgF [unclassified Polynucleobacter]|uniref:tol-pal system protein YbgF n=1 Tax=unclassified Polynucleobacter TaxID=2640945 RepID=UPI002493C2E5|nr:MULTISPECIES: tol-pal system protein YbgF [unclassified Polynucleobacter]